MEEQDDNPLAGTPLPAKKSLQSFKDTNSTTGLDILLIVGESQTIKDGEVSTGELILLQVTRGVGHSQVGQGMES
jgi:hypothetical protein